MEAGGSAVALTGNRRRSLALSRLFPGFAAFSRILASRNRQKFPVSHAEIDHLGS
jgi:hypothetical protein